MISLIYQCTLSKGFRYMNLQPKISSSIFVDSPSRSFDYNLLVNPYSVQKIILYDSDLLQRVDGMEDCILKWIFETSVSKGCGEK